MSNSSIETDNPLLMKKSIELVVRIGLILLLMVWCFQIISPFIAPIIWGIVIAIGTYPIFFWFKSFRWMFLATLITYAIFIILTYADVVFRY